MFIAVHCFSAHYGVVRDYEVISYQFTPTLMRATNLEFTTIPAIIYERVLQCVIYLFFN